MWKKSNMNNWRKLDNTAKIFSLENKSNTNVFRYSVLLKANVDISILKIALDKTVEMIQAFKVKIGTGFFWNYLEFNDKVPKIMPESEMPCEHINFRKNNDYLFKVTYYKNKINVDVYHVLTDGTGAMTLLKMLIYNYLNLKYKLVLDEEFVNINKYQDLNLKYYNKKYKMSYSFKSAYQLPGRANLRINKTCHYILNIKEFKRVCKDLKVTVTEYLTAVYIYALYLSLYKRGSKKEINITVPINLRKIFNEETLTNFFTYMNVESNIIGKKRITFKNILKHVCKEFKEKLTEEKIKEYLARDVKLGMNLSIRLVPLTIKKFFIKFMGEMVTKTTTSTLSNLGIVDIHEKYKKYIDNILIIGKPNRVQKIKCTVCSYDNKLNITVNSNIKDNEFQVVFLEILQRYMKKIKVVSNNL